MMNIIYPFIFSLFPLLSAYLTNFSQVPLADTISPLLLIELLTMSIYAISLLITRNFNKSSIITFIFLFFIFSFEPIFSPIRKIYPIEHVIKIYIYYFYIWVGLFIISIFAVFIFAKYLKAINLFLSVFTTILVAITLIQILLNVQKIYNSNFQNTDLNNILASEEELSTTELPDVYYIILDRYLRADILQINYEYDNSKFINYLKEKGFYVVEKSHSNYLKTGHSLASSLNMRYINYLSEDVGESNNSWLPIYDLIKKNEVGLTFKHKGYKYIHIGSWWDPTRKNEYADININNNELSEFSDNIFRNTFFYPIKDTIFAEGIRKEQYNRTIYEIEYLKNIPLNKEPTFTFAHLLITHLPYVFAENGGFMEGSGYDGKSESEIYVIQVKIANKIMADLIEDIIKKSETKPIIIVQSDEGNFPHGVSPLNYKFNWFEANQKQIEEKFSILNAIYLPGENENVFKPELTPVNTFRIVFNELFNAKMELLPNESFLNQDDLHPYKFRKI